MDFEVVGRHALLFDDDAMAAFVNSADALVDWHSLQIDRYDVRHLLSAPPPPRRRVRNYESKPSDELLIDQERYLDLPPDSDQPEVEDDEKPSGSDGYHSVAFLYGNTDDSADQKNTDGGMESSVYLPPFAIPGNISLPPTEKVHQIIARTAIFVSKHGGQSEIILRVKQGDNPTFGFLMPDHHLHAYFRYLVEHPELLHTEIDEKSQDERKNAGSEHNNSNSVGGALSLLGSVYGSGEDEDGDDAVNPSLSHDTKKVESTENAAKDESTFRKPILSNKESVPAVKKNSSIIASKPKSVKGIKKEVSPDLFSAAEEKSKNYETGAISKPQILEPPPELKRLIDKLVEFVMRNGKQFEATLIEQDNTHEKFPFLLPSNQYHPYYLKALQAAQESKVNGKSSYSGKDDLGGRGINKKASLFRENDLSYSSFDLCDVPFESDRKEKFKMVIGKSKKEGQETDKGTQESEVTVNAAAAAAILQAATRGIKNPDLQNVNRSSGGEPASLGSLQPSVPDNAAEKSDQSGSYNQSVIAPKGIAETASLGALGGADSSDANMTEERKRKAERLKRAKMFVAMLKSGAAPSKTGTSRGSSVEPLDSGVLMSTGEVTNQETEGNLAPAAVNKPAATGDVGERQSERLSKRIYRSKSGGCEEDSPSEGHKEGHLKRKYRSRSRRHEDDEKENAVDKEHKHRWKKGRRQSHSSEDNKYGGESSEEDDGFEGIGKEERDEKRNEHHSKRKYSSRSRRHVEDDEVENAVEKEHKHRRRRLRSYSSSEENENGEESDEPDKKHKHYKPTHRSHRSRHDDHEREGIYEEGREKEHRESHSSRSYRSRSRRHEEDNEIESAVEEEGKYNRKRHLSHSSYEENSGESGGDDRDMYEKEKDRKRSKKHRHSHHSSHESSRRHSCERHKKHRSSHSSHRSRDKHRHRNSHSSKDKESRNRHKHDSSPDDEIQSADQSEKESYVERDELEEGEISSKVSEESRGLTSGHGKRGTSVDVMSSERRASSQPSETTEVPADLRAKIRAMLMATRS